MGKSIDVAFGRMFEVQSDYNLFVSVCTVWLLSVEAVWLCWMLVFH